MINEFKDFLKNYGVVGLAIAVIIGGKLNELVNSVVNDLILPIILQPVLATAHIDNIRNWNISGIYIGKVLGSCIEFLIVALIVFFFAKFIMKEKFVQKK